MDYELYIKVCTEEDVALKKWGHVDRNPGDLLDALLEEAGEVAHAINHDEGKDKVNQEIVETIGVLSRLYTMVNGSVREEVKLATQIFGTDTKEFTQVAEVQIWRKNDGTSWDLWIGNTLYHCSCISEVISRLDMYLRVEKG